MWNLIVGFVMPILIALLQQPGLKNWIRATITAVVSIVAGFLTAYFNNQLDFQNIVSSVLVVGVAAITFYKGFWKPTGVAPAIENATSKTPPTVQQAHPDDLR
jgi:hypothetical protein